MAETSLTLRDGTQVDSSAEIYPRIDRGKFGGRLGVVGDLVPALDCFRMIVVERSNDERIISAIKSMLEKARQQELGFDYECIIDTFQSYVDHGDSESLVSAKGLCTTAAPKFAEAFKQSLDKFNPYAYEYGNIDYIKNSLKPLIAASDVYLIVLSIGFFTQTKLMPSTALNDRVVLPRIDNAIKLLEDRLENTLLPGGRVARSLMASLLLRGKHKCFLEYYPYCRNYTGEAGVVKMVAAANEKEENDRGYWQGYNASSDTPGNAYYVFADTLIELLNRFKKMRYIRLNFNQNDPPISDPRTINFDLESETPLLIGGASENGK